MGTDRKLIRKVALVSNTSWSVYNFRLGLMRKLRALGIEVHVIAPKDRFSARLVSEGFRFHPLKLNNYSLNPIWDIQTFLHLFRYYRKYDFDHILHYTIKPNIYGSIASYCNRTPSFAITTGLGRLFSYRSWVVQRFVLFMYRFACRFSVKVGFVNQIDQSIFINRRMVAKEKAFLLNSEGVNLNYFRPRPMVPSRKELVFLYAGRIIWDKGMKSIVEAARYFKRHQQRVKFQLLGFVNPDNPGSISFEELEKWQKEELVEYLGETEDVRQYIAQADCIVFPSYYGEGISRLLLEAGAMAKPIITSDHVGCREVVKSNVNGLLCQPDSPESFIDCIKEFMKLTFAQRARMGVKSREYISYLYDEEIIIHKYLELLLGKDVDQNLVQEDSTQSSVASI